VRAASPQSWRSEIVHRGEALIVIDIPGFRRLELVHLVLDYNGTLAVDGEMLEGVADALVLLSRELTIHVVTADTFGLAAEGLSGLPVSLVFAPSDGQDLAKLEYVRRLGSDYVVAIGNGRNDRRMVKSASLGIALVQREGVAVETLANADVACTGIFDALALLLNPKRLVATLRS